MLEDVQALQYIREGPGFTNNYMELMAGINNHTASIQSRLASLSGLSPVQECCRLAAYMSSVMLCCTVWCALVIPVCVYHTGTIVRVCLKMLILFTFQSHISSRLLRELLQANREPVWDENPELLLWLLYIGGAFASEGIIRAGYVALLRSHGHGRFGGLCSTWPEVLMILRQFTWSDKAFMAPVKAFWEEVST